MDVVFWFLIWVSSPGGGYSEFFGDIHDCGGKRTQIISLTDTLYVSDCVRVELKFVKSVPQDYKPESEIKKF